MPSIRTLSLGCAALAILAPGCRKTLTAEAIEKSPAAMVEQGPTGTSTWVVQPDGAVQATLKTPDGKPVAQPVTGQVTFTPPNGAPTSVPVAYDPKTGVLTAAGPKLDADITPVTYSLQAGDAPPFAGSLDVPRGGTEDLVDTGKEQAAIPPGTIGSNGGVVQVVGPDRVELVTRPSGYVRAYVLDPTNHPVDPGNRTITVAVQGPQPQVVVLTPEPQGHFVVGHLHPLVDAPPLTVAVNQGGTTHGCLVGWLPGAPILVGNPSGEVAIGAPSVVVNAPGVAVNAPGVVVSPPGVAVNAPGVAVNAPSVEVSAPGVVVNPPSVEVNAPTVAVGAPGVVVDSPGVVVGAPGVVVGAPGVMVGAPGVVVGGPGVVVGGPGVVVPGPHVAVGAPGVMVPGPHVALGAPGVMVPGPHVGVGGPGVVVGGGAAVHGGWGHGHEGHEHEHGHGR